MLSSMGLGEDVISERLKNYKILNNGSYTDQYKHC